MAKTILVVDDDTDFLSSIAELLRIRGYSVLEYSDPRAALESCRENEDIDWVLTDLDMPHMNGISLLAGARRIRPMIEGLLMTGNPQWSQSASPDYVACLRKPFSSDELLQAIEKPRQR